MNILYLLKLNDYPNFKVGITSQSVTLNRIKNLNRIYNFSLEDSYLIKCSNPGIIKALENTIKFSYEIDCPECFKGKDGATELRSIEVWGNVLKYIQAQNDHLSHLGIQIEKGLNTLPTNVPSKKKVYSNSIRKKTVKHHSYYLEETRSDLTSLFYIWEKLIIENKCHISKVEYCSQDRQLLIEFTGSFNDSSLTAAYWDMREFGIQLFNDKDIRSGIMSFASRYTDFEKDKIGQFVFSFHPFNTRNSNQYFFEFEGICKRRLKQENIRIEYSEQWELDIRTINDSFLLNQVPANQSKTELEIETTKLYDTWVCALDVFLHKIDPSGISASYCAEKNAIRIEAKTELLFDDIFDLAKDVMKTVPTAWKSKYFCLCNEFKQLDEVNPTCKNVYSFTIAFSGFLEQQNGLHSEQVEATKKLLSCVSKKVKLNLKNSRISLDLVNKLV